MVLFGISHGGVIGCKQFSCSGDAVWRLIMGCRRMLGAWDRAAIMAVMNVGLSQMCIARLIGRSPSVVCREIARHTGPDGGYRAEESGKAARAGPGVVLRIACWIVMRSFAAL